MQSVQRDWIKFILKALRGVKMRRDNIKKPFKDLYVGGDEALVFDLPDDLLGEFGSQFSMMGSQELLHEFYDKVN